MLKNLQVYNQYYRAQCTWHTSISMFYSVYWHCNFKRQVIANKQRQNVNFWCGIENCTYCQSTLCFQPAHPLYWLTPKETVTTACESVNWLTFSASNKHLYRVQNKIFTYLQYRNSFLFTIFSEKLRINFLIS